MEANGTKMTDKVSGLIFKKLVEKFKYSGDVPDYYEACKFLNKHNYNISVVRHPQDNGHYCYVQKISKPYGINTEKIIWRDSWSEDFSYDECVHLCLYYWLQTL